MRRLVQGNEASALGAVAAGCRFFGGYPITPSTEIAEYMSVNLPKLGGVFIQMEDEIASMASIIGASLGGLKSMTATSGPGFSLMQENIGYACMAEIPVVVVNVMRGGPSTGLPTMPSQGDFMQARWGTHGEHAAIAYCPSSVEESYYLTIKAFETAEYLRNPVFVLMDEVIGHMREVVDIPEEIDPKLAKRKYPDVSGTDFMPFGQSDWDPAPFIPFEGSARYHVTGLMHDSRGYPTSRPDEIETNLRRLVEKIESRAEELSIYEEIQTDDADLILVAYGSVARCASRVVTEARREGLKVGALILKTVWPFPDHLFRGNGRVPAKDLRVPEKGYLVPEMNMGQAVLEVERAVLGKAPVNLYYRIDGSLITPEELLSAVKENMK
jgi:2-oxoglutarate ferredoxin oxidoreductase subunit alpha